MDNPTICNHAGAVKWFPFKRHVACASCGQVFFRAVSTRTGYALLATGDVDINSEKEVAASALAAFRHVTNDAAAVPDVRTLEHYIMIVRGVHLHLMKLFHDKNPGCSEDVPQVPQPVQ